MKPTKPKINPGKGWRLLRGNEIVTEGDEFTMCGKPVWSHVIHTIGCIAKNTRLTFRRRTTRK